MKQYLLNEKDDFSRLVQLLSIKNYDCIIVLLNAFSITSIKRIGDFDTEKIEHFIYGNLIRNILLINEVVAYCKHNSIQLRIINFVIKKYL